MAGHRNESPRCARKSNGYAGESVVKQRNGKVKSLRAQECTGEGLSGKALFGNGIEMNRSVMA